MSHIIIKKKKCQGIANKQGSKQQGVKKKFSPSL